MLQDLSGRPEVTRVGLLQLLAGTAAQHHNFDVWVAAMLPLHREALPDRLTAAALGELPHGVRAGPAVVNDQEVPHV